MSLFDVLFMIACAVLILIVWIVFFKHFPRVVRELLKKIKKLR